MTTKNSKSSLAGRSGELTPRERATLDRALNLDKNRSPKGCFKNTVTGGDNLITTGTFTIALGVTLTVSDGDEWVVL